MNYGLLQAYLKDAPAYIAEYASAPEMQRLKDVDMNCGMNYTSFPLFDSIEPYSRYEHSLGTAYLLAGFCDDKKVILSGLFHDIASPVFSHVIDFVNGDHQKQESTEDATRSLIESSSVIMPLLERDGLRVEDVCDYHMYPLADNDSPRLCADRLEYTLGNIVNYHFGTMSQVEKFLADLAIGINEDGDEEIMFQTPETAEEFALLAMKCGHVYSCDPDRYGMEHLALLLKKAVRMKILRYDDFCSTEPEVIRMLEESVLADEWKAFRALASLQYEQTEKEGYLQVHTKRRYIDPLCSGIRVSAFSEAYRTARDAFLHENQDVWMHGISKKEIVR